MKIEEGMSRFLKMSNYEFKRYSLIAHFFVNLKGNLLDVGCCHGGLRKFLDKNINYFGIDGLDNQFQNYIKTDLNKIILPFKNQSFDAICCCATLEHLFYPLEILREIKRVLKNDGRILISLPNDEGLNGIISSFQKVKSYDESIYGHHWRFSINTTRDFVSKEFEIISEKAEFGPLYRKYFFWLKVKKLCTEWIIYGKKPAK
jgi:SAM-dependent methyltransferase